MHACLCVERVLNVCACVCANKPNGSCYVCPCVLGCICARVRVCGRAMVMWCCRAMRMCERCCVVSACTCDCMCVLVFGSPFNRLYEQICVIVWLRISCLCVRVFGCVCVLIVVFECVRVVVRMRLCDCKCVLS